MIELLLATALAAVLMFAVLQVTTSLGKTSRLIALQAYTKPLWQMNLERLLKQDLAEASRIVVDKNALTLEGALGLDQESFKRTHQPTRVIYRTVSLDRGIMMLLREQQDLLSPSNRHRQIMLVCNNIRTFAMEVLEDDAKSAQRYQDTNRPSPDRYRLTLQAGDAAAFEHVVLPHR